jgi:flagellar biosynthesis/type III secretory pathway chaperone
MSRHVIELESVLQLLTDEHRRMLGHVEAQQNAMKLLKLDAMEDAMHRQESSRLRIAALENRRRLLVQQISKLARAAGELTLTQIAAASSTNGAKLLALGDELRQLMRQISDRTHVAGRLASAVLGHLNTALRLFAGAVGQAGVYTKAGVPKVANRIGVMEAVG